MGTQSGKLRIKITAKDQASSKLSKVTGAIKGMVVAYLGFRTVKAAIGAVKEFTRLAMIQEQAVINLTAALKQQGITSEKTLKSLKDYASELQGVTVHGDEAIMEVEALLLRLGVTPQYLKQATMATLNWADALGKDLKSASLDIGKAFTGNLMMLQRYGVRIDAEKVRTEGFGVVLKALEEKFGGASKAMAESFQGRLKQIGNLFSDLKEKIGDVIVKSSAWKAVFGFIVEKLTQFNKWLQENEAQVIEWGNKTAFTVVNVGRFIIETILDIGTAVSALGKGLASVGLFLAKLDEKFVGWIPGLKKFTKDEVFLFQELRDGLDEVGVGAQIARIGIGNLADELDRRMWDAVTKATKGVKSLANNLVGGKGVEGGGLAGGLREVQQVMVDMNRTMTENKDMWLFGTDKVREQLPQMKNDWLDFFGAVYSKISDFAQSWMTNVVDSIFEGRFVFQQFVRDFMIGVSKMIAKLLLMKAIKMAFGIPFAEGGIVPGFQHGGVVPGTPPYRDKVPALLTPGERVLSRREYAALGGERGLQKVLHNHFSPSIVVNVSGTQSGQMIADTIEDRLKELVRRRKIKFF